MYVQKLKFLYKSGTRGTTLFVIRKNHWPKQIFLHGVVEFHNDMELLN